MQIVHHRSRWPVLCRLRAETEGAAGERYLIVRLRADAIMSLDRQYQELLRERNGYAGTV